MGFLKLDMKKAPALLARRSGNLAQCNALRNQHNKRYRRRYLLEEITEGHSMEWCLTCPCNSKCPLFREFVTEM